MKTSVTIIRQLGNYKVSQRTKDGYFNASELAKQWSETLSVRKEVNDYLRLKSTEEYLHALENELNS